MSKRHSHSRLSLAEIKRRVKELRARELAEAKGGSRNHQNSSTTVPTPHLEPKDHYQPSPTLLTWRHAASRARQWFGTQPAYYSYLKAAEFDCEIGYLGRGGIVAARLFAKGDRTKPINSMINYNIATHEWSISCNCDRPIDQTHCQHTFSLARYVSSELEQRYSVLTKRIEASDFDTQPVRIEDYQPDHASLILSRLNHYFEDVSVVDDQLPEMVEKLAEQLVWNIVIEENRLGLELLHQRARKRGVGWLKGKEVRPHELFQRPELLVSDQDRRAAKAIEYRQATNFYGPQTTIDYVRLLEQLRDHPAVQLNDQTVEITRADLRFVLKENDGYYAVKLNLTTVVETQHRLFVCDGGLVLVEPEQHRIVVAHASPPQVKMVRELFKNPLKIRKDKIAEYLPMLRRLSEHLPLTFPTELAGEARTDTPRPAIVLRSRPTGELDFGLRVRTESGGLFRCAQGSVCRLAETEGVSIQWQRDFPQERKLLHKLTSRLGVEDQLDPALEMGTIDDFVAGLKFLDAVDQLGDEVEVCWDRRSERRPSVLGSVTAKNLRVQIDSKRDWFGISGGCDFGDKTVNLADILSNMVRHESDGADGEFIQVAPDQWARVSHRLHQRLQRLADHAHSERGNLKLDKTAALSIQDLVEEDIQIDAPRKWAETVQRLRQAEKLQPVVPSDLHAELRSYQEEGFAWMRRLAEWGVGGVLADDMGLGKTVQTLAVLIDRSDAGPALVIAPTSVGFNWAREAERFAPTMKAHLYRDTDRNEFLTSVGPGDIVICSYGLALRDEKLLAGVNWATMVLDEAQAVKNARSKTTRAVTVIPADWKIALTGTPVENHLGELWSIFRIVSPGLLGGWDQFRQKFATPIERDNCPKRRAALSQVMQPFILRRTKQEVLKDLPDRTESNLYVDLSNDERARYESWRMAALGEIDGIEAMTGTEDARFQILAVLTRLRQLACNVGLVDKTWTGKSSKLELLLETMQELRSEGHRALIFSQFTSHLDKIRQAFDEVGITYQYLDGSTPAKARGGLVDKFQAGEGDAFLISLKAGGTGLNLTAADYVIHMDPWWNPAVEDQATDRAHRIGQVNPVMVYRIVARGTIEEEILRLHESKRDLVANILDGTSKAAKLSTEELVSMIRGHQE